MVAALENPKRQPMTVYRTSECYTNDDSRLQQSAKKRGVGTHALFYEKTGLDHESLAPVCGKGMRNYLRSFKFTYVEEQTEEEID